LITKFNLSGRFPQHFHAGAFAKLGNSAQL